MRAEECWLANSLVVVLDGVHYLKLKRTSAGLHRFVGTSLHHNGFLDEFLRLRNVVCQELIDESSDRLDASTKRHFIGPKVITVEAPRFSTTKKPIDMTIAFETNFRSVLTVQLCSDGLMYFIEGIRATEGTGQRWTKRKVQNPGCDLGCWNNQRESLFVKYRDEEGRSKTRHCKPRTMESAQIKIAEQRLQRFLEENHVDAGCGEDGEHAILNSDDDKDAEAEDGLNAGESEDCVERDRRIPEA